MNLVWGVAAMGAAGLLLCLAWRLARGGRPLAAAVAIAGAGLALRLYAGCDLYLHAWDERFHAVVAKHLVEHPLVPTLYEHPVLPFDYRDWRANAVWLHKPPLALWLMAAGMRVLGVDEIAMRVPSLVLSTVAVFLTCVIGMLLCGRRVGLLAGAFHAVNGYLVQLPAGRVAVDHVDNTLVFLVELGVLFALAEARAERRPSASPADGHSRRVAWGALAALGITVGLALLTKWLPGLLPIPVWLALVWGRRRGRRIAAELAIVVALALAVVLPWNEHVQRAFPREAAWESAYNLRHLVVPIEGLGGSPLFHLARMPRYFGELVYLPVAWLIVMLVRRWRSPRERRALLPIAVWLLLPYLAFSLAATKLGGYVMVAAPAVFLAEAAFWIWLLERRDAAPVRLPAGAWAALRLGVLVLLPLLPLRYTVERLKVRASYERNPAWARALRALPAALGPGPLVLFHLDEPIEAMFYTPYTAYQGMPTPEQARRLLDAGYRVVVFDAAAAPTALRAVPGVELHAEAIPPAAANDGTGVRARRADLSDSPLAGTGGAPGVGGPPH